MGLLLILPSQRAFECDAPGAGKPSWNQRQLGGRDLVAGDSSPGVVG